MATVVSWVGLLWKQCFRLGPGSPRESALAASSHYGGRQGEV